MGAAKANVAIVGGGPSGSYLATLLAKRGAEVDLYEAKSKYDIPCGEAVPGPKVAYWGKKQQVWKDIEKHINNTTLNEVYGFRVTIIDVDKKIKIVESVRNNVLGYIIDKPLFVMRLRFEAEKYGTNILYKHADPVELARSGEYDIVVDARGPLTDTTVKRLAVVRSYALPRDELDTRILHFWFVWHILGYGWAFPHDNRFNIGAGCLGCGHNDLMGLLNLVIDKADVIEIRNTRRGWSIIAEPPNRPLAEVVDNAVLVRVGEAAGHVMYHSGEGIRPALLSAFVVANSIDVALSMPSISEWWHTEPERLAKFIEGNVKRSRVHKDSMKSYTILQFLKALWNRGLQGKALRLLPKNAWYRLFGGRDPVINVIAPIALRLL
jgi:flavin-dependent dehydrogenase